mgnify:CR=1 FL=1
MTTDAIVMMVITLVGYVGGFTYFMVRVFQKEKRNNQK